MLRELSLKFKIIIAFILIGFLPLLITSIISYISLINVAENESFNKLTAVRENKKEEIEGFFNTIKGQIKTLSNDVMIIDAMAEFKKAFHNIEDSLSLNETKLDSYNSKVTQYYINDFLPRLNKIDEVSNNVNQFLPDENKSIILQNLYFASNTNAVGEKENLDFANDGSEYSSVHKKYHPSIRQFLREFGYYDIFLVDNETGHIVYSVFKEVDFATSLIFGPYKNTNFARTFNNARKSNNKDFISLEDFEPYDPSYQAAASFISSPIFDINNKIIGVLIFQMPVDKINTIMTSNGNWKNVGLGESGEIYLVADDFTLRNNSRFLIEDENKYLEALKNANVESNILNKPLWIRNP